MLQNTPQGVAVLAGSLLIGLMAMMPACSRPASDVEKAFAESQNSTQARAELTVSPATATRELGQVYSATLDVDVVMSSPDYSLQAFLWWQEEIADRDLKLIEDAGFRWVKQEFAWREIEGAAKGRWQWETPDRIIDQIEEHTDRLSYATDSTPALTCFPKNEKGCLAYNRLCPYHEYCKVWSNPLKNLDRRPYEFKEEYWDPRTLDTNETTVINL